MKSCEEAQSATADLADAVPDYRAQTSETPEIGRARAAVAAAIVCAIGAAVALVTAGDIAAFVWTARPATKLADPPRVSKLIGLAGILLGIGVSLGVASWRARQPGTAQRLFASQWSIGFTFLWGLLALYTVALYYPLPYHSHHIDKLLLCTALILLWSLVFVLRPAALSILLTSRLSSWLKTGLINVLVFVCVGEAVFRLMDPILARGGLFGNKHSPADLRPHVETHGSIGVTNSQGFRDRERMFARTSDAPRLVALGDSFTYGAGITYDEIFTTVLERSLQDMAPGLEMINLGVSGWDPSEYVHLFKVYGSKFEPDVVMMNFFIGNDIMRRRGAYVEQPMVVAGRSYYVHSIGNWLHDTLGPDRWFLYHHVNYLVTVGASRLDLSMGNTDATDIGSWRPLRTKQDYLKDIDERSEIYVKVYSPLFEYHWRRTLATLEDIQRFLRDRDIPLVLVLLPAQEQVDPVLQGELMTALGTGPDDFSKPQRLLKAWGEQHEVAVMDLLPAFEQTPDPQALYFERDIHWTQSGHALAATNLLPKIRRLIASTMPPDRTPKTVPQAQTSGHHDIGCAGERFSPRDRGSADTGGSVPLDSPPPKRTA